MSANKTLTLMPYYGGKAKMARFIADKLNYFDTDIYIEPFGGACSVLLNKPRHKREIYNDLSRGTSAVIKVLSDKERASEFIHKLYETEYSKEEFNRAKEYLYEYEATMEKVICDNIKCNLEEWMGRIGYKNKNLVQRIIKELKCFDNEKMAEQFKQDIEKLMGKSKGHDVKDMLKELCGYTQILADTSGYERGRHLNHSVSENEMELAVATYIVFTQSRDGIGGTFSGSKNTEKYRKKIEKLYLCAERLENVEVYQNDAMEFFQCYESKDENNKINITPFYFKDSFLENPKVMFYCDPSYLPADSEEEDKDSKKKDKNLGKSYIDSFERDQHEDFTKCVTDEPADSGKENKDSKKKNKNLGKSYVASFERKQHEDFLKFVTDERVQAKIMISNYDNKLYNEYLTEKNGWKKMKFETITTVGGKKKGNKRTEVLWYNY